MDLKSAFKRANKVTPTKSATSLEVGKYIPIETMEKRTTRFGAQVLVTFTTGQKVWLPNSFSRNLSNEVISSICPGEWELSFQGMKLVASRFTKALFDVRKVVVPAPASPSRQPDWGDDDMTFIGENEKSPSIL